MLLSQHVEAHFLKRCSVFLQRGKIAFFLLAFPEPIFQCAPEQGKSVVHIDDHANSSWRQQIEDRLRTIQFLPRAMTVSDGGYTKDEMKRVFQVGLRCFQR